MTTTPLKQKFKEAEKNLELLLQTSADSNDIIEFLKTNSNIYFVEKCLEKTIQKNPLNEDLLKALLFDFIAKKNKQLFRSRR